MQTVEAIIDKNGAVRLLGSVKLPKERRALVTILDEEPIDSMGSGSDDSELWLTGSSETLEGIWDNEEDDVYAELLKV
ncbi:MAG TPA: hypothetical protein PKD24_09100 [Pyrinomonadaceae bacterium]|nr:hypothetical protein [Pyrinomonadaceae bacterium]HMP65775.1 hypothetical protein [Pyrinomonadaceae bacterium]